MYDREKYVAIKRKIRDLKKLENKIQNECARNSIMYGNLQHRQLVWNTFFDLDEKNSNSKYTMNQLLTMTKEELKTVIDEFLRQIFDCYYAMIDQEDMLEVKNRISKTVQYDDVMNKVKLLMKEYHPDNGGDSEKFIEVFEKYRRLKKEFERENHVDEIL